MTGDDDRVKPSEQRGGSTPGADEARAKGEWAGTAADGVVPAELGGSDAPRELLDEDPQLGSSVLGETTGSEAPATTMGSTSPSATAPRGDRRRRRAPAEGEPDLRDVAAGPRGPTSTRPGSARRDGPSACSRPAARDLRGPEAR